MSGLEVTDEEVENCTKDILDAIDVDSDGDITKVGIRCCKDYYLTFHF